MSGIKLDLGLDLGVPRSTRRVERGTLFLVIRSFADKATETLFETGHYRSFGTASASAFRELKQLDAVQKLDELRIPPGNRLEALKSSRAGQHSIRVNDQYRVCFRWTEQGPEDVEVVDYH